MKKDKLNNLIFEWFPLHGKEQHTLPVNIPDSVNIQELEEIIKFDFKSLQNLGLFISFYKTDRSIFIIKAVPVSPLKFQIDIFDNDYILKDSLERPPELLVSTLKVIDTLFNPFGLLDND